MIAVPKLSAEAVATKSLLASPRWSPSGAQVAWVHVTGSGAQILVAPVVGTGPDARIGVATPLAAEIDVACPHPTSGALAWIDEDTILVCAKGAHFTIVPLDGGPTRMLPAHECSTAPAISPDGARVAFVTETADDCFVAVMSLDGAEPPVRVSSADFAFDPQWSPGGDALVWQAWDLPHLPFIESRIERVIRGDDGWGLPEVVVGGPGVAASQPRFAPDGRFLAYCCDDDGMMRVHVRDLSLGTTRVLGSEGEHASPTWGTGDRSYAWSPTGRALAINVNVDGFGALHVIDLEGDDASRPIAKAWHRSLDWTMNGIIAVRSGAKTPPQVVQYAEPLTSHDGTRTIVTTALADNFGGLVEPVPVTWTRNGTTLHGLWWARPAADGPPPVLVHLHGGPTDQATADWDIRRQYFVQRGWAVFTPNPRGSTGYGRSYVDGVRGGWGVVDLADVVAGIEQVIPRLGGDPERVVAMGGSAGGYLVLRLCTEYPNLLDAAISVYGVTDLLGLAATTWRRESGYEDWLVGPLPEFEAEYRERSPLHGAHRIRTPLLLLQGDADQVVNISQYEALLGAVRASGTPVEGHVYADEGHGFSKPETKIDEVQRIDAFLARTRCDRDAAHDTPVQ